MLLSTIQHFAPFSLCPAVLPLNHKWFVKWFKAFLDHFSYSIVLNGWLEKQGTNWKENKVKRIIIHL